MTRNREYQPSTLAGPFVCGIRWADDGITVAYPNAFFTVIASVISSLRLVRSPQETKCRDSPFGRLVHSITILLVCQNPFGPRVCHSRAGYGYQLTAHDVR